MADNQNTDLATDVLKKLDELHLEAMRHDTAKKGNTYPAVVSLRAAAKFVRNHPEGQKSDYSAMDFMDVIEAERADEQADEPEWDEDYTRDDWIADEIFNAVVSLDGSRDLRDESWEVKSKAIRDHLKQEEIIK